MDGAGEVPEARLAVPGRERQRLLSAALGYLLLVLGFTWPVCLHLNERFLGSPNTDVCVGIWGFWWYHRALSGGHSPFHGDVLGFPNGGTFFVADPLNALLSVPLLMALDVSTAYNLVIMGNLLLAALATFALLRYMRVPAPAAFVGGAAYALNVYVASYIQNGASQEVAIGWFPLFVLRFLVLLRSGGLANLGWACLTLALTMMSSWYHAACVSLLIPFLVWPFRRRPQIGRWAVWTVCGGLILVTPYLLAQLYVLGDFHTLEVRQSLPLEASLESQDGSDIVRFFSHAQDAGWLKRGYLHAPSLGWVVLDLALWGGLLARRRALARRWVAPALAFLVLASGFLLEIDGWLVTVGDRLVTMPFLFLYRFLPGFSWLGFPHRFVVPALLALSCMAAVGAADLMRGRAQRERVLIGVCLTLGIFLEVVLLNPLIYPMATTAVDTHAFYARAGASDERYGIIDLPTTSALGPVAKRYFYYQTLHAKGIPYGIDATVGKRFPGSFARHPSLGRLAAFDVRLGFQGERSGPRECVADLRALGYRYVVLHTRQMSDVHLAGLRLFLQQVLKSPEREGDLLIYSLQ